MTSLTEQEQIGLKLLALYRSGQLNLYKCSTCIPELKEDRNCAGGEGSSSVFSHKDVGNFNACPLRFIPRCIFTFIDRYDYYEKYPSAVPSYEDVNARYWDSVKFYEDFVVKLENDKQPDKTETNNDNLSRMAGLFKKE